MKKSLLSLALLFSLWSFAVIKFNLGGSITAAPVKEEAPEKEITAAVKPVVVKKSATATAAYLPPLTPAAYPLPKGSQWSYLDNGTDQGTAWSGLAFDNSSWSTGTAPMGYGDAATTVISYGPDSGNKYITYYFSRDVQVDLASMADVVEFGIRRDDGVIVYVNGVEVIRDNMPAGDVTYLTHSASIVDGVDEKRYKSFYVAKTAFTDGVNRISVEVHNRDGQSSDIGFDMYVQDKAPDFVCEEGHIGCFTSINPTGQTPVMIYPAEQRFQMLFKQGDQYMDGSGTVPGNHDFTGYIPSVGETASTVGYLSVNHENAPGGVSILDITLDEGNYLWNVNDSRKVDIYNEDLVTTTRNCSGGITPWGTIITAEESTNGGDVNGDGYNDEGWLVEIDPATAAVKEYGNGKQEKLWAMGRMNHENVVISADGTTAYYGEDGGSHCVYKFIADTPNNFYSGTLYVLDLDLDLANDEPCSPTGVWKVVPNSTPAECNAVATNAQALGGTNFNGVEDCEIGPDGMIYFTAKGRNRVYRFTDSGEGVTNFETFVGGMTYPIETAGGIIMEEWRDGNDNLAFDDKGNLWVVQDGGRNYIWVVRPNHRQSDPQVLIHSSMPNGSEPTGLTFSPDFKYGFFSVQHPESGNASQVDATGNEVTFNASAALVFSNQNLLGTQIPVTDFSGNNLEIEAGGSVQFTDLSTNNPTTWTWTFEGGTPATSTEQNPTVSYAEPGTYNVTLVASNTAGENEAAKEDYIVVEAVNGLEENQLAGKVSVYPNPTNGIVNIELNDDAGKEVSIAVFDFTGRRVHEANAQTTGVSQKVELNLTKLAGEQVFFIQIQVGDKTGTYKLMKVSR